MKMTRSWALLPVPADEHRDHDDSGATVERALGYLVIFVDFFRRRRSSARRISSSRRAGDAIPLCSHILGYMLMEVNPGMVLISLMYSRSVANSRKKSTRAIPSHSTAL